MTKALNELSPSQKKAAEWKEGPLLVLAGPGSGKTRVLTCHIANIFDSSMDSNFRVLGLTFTNKAADEMRSRVDKYSPAHESRVFLGTFHSFCADVLRQHGTHLGINPNFNIYSQDDDLQEILNDAVEIAKRNLDVVEDVHKKTLPIIHRLKSQLIQPEESKDKFRDPQFGEIIATVYSAYETELLKRNALDFDSLLFKTYQLFNKFPTLANRYRMVYPHICVDEFQDTNQAQYNLLRILCGSGYRNLFIVADDDQIIYQWNGASHKRIDQFITDYSASIIQLPTNYRCPPEIVGLANSLISHNFFRQPNKEPLQAFRPQIGEQVVRLLPRFEDCEAEAAGIASDIKELHSQNFGSIAILGRSRRLLNSVEHALNQQHIPAVISQRKDEFESTPMVWLHSVLRLANDKYNRRFLEAVCGTFTQLTQFEVDPESIISQAQASNIGYLLQWVKSVRQFSSDALINEITLRLGQFLSGGMNFQNFGAFSFEWFEKLIRSTEETTEDPNIEVFPHYQEERATWIELISEIGRTLGADMTLEAFLQELQMRSKESPSKPNTVTLLTIHGSKGKEFDYIYLIGMVEDEMPSFQSRQKGDRSPEMEEERRNCFVAITRAKESLTLSYAKVYRGWNKQPSRFLAEMGLTVK
jgi:DNA helicase-2/ATP-dependent DNA helicase PcrA